MLAVQHVCWNSAQFACSPIRHSIRPAETTPPVPLPLQKLNGPEGRNEIARAFADAGVENRVRWPERGGRFSSIFEKTTEKKIEGATSAGLLALRVLRPLIDP